MATAVAASTAANMEEGNMEFPQSRPSPLPVRVAVDSKEATQSHTHARVALASEYGGRTAPACRNIDFL